MAWHVHYRRDDQSHQATVSVWSDAIVLACELLREGLVVEKIQADTGLTLLSRHLVPLCDSATY